MEINNVLVYTEQHEFVSGSISFEDGIIKDVSLTGEAAAGNDVAGDDALYAIPGLVPDEGRRTRQAP